MTEQKMMMVAASVLVLGLAPACKKHQQAGDHAKAAAKVAATADPGPANAAIPAAWKGKLEFTVQQLGDHDDVVSAAAPKGWKQGVIPGMLEAPDDGGFGFGVHFWAGKTCQGECTAKPAAKWEAAADKHTFANLLDQHPAPKVIKDEKAPGHRTLIVEGQHTDGNVNMTSIAMVWWKDGADRMYFCNVDLAPESKDLVSTFEQACAKLAIDF